MIRNPDDYLLYDEVFARYRAQGGMSGYAHVAGDWFNVGQIHRSNETPAISETAELRLAVIDETGTSTPVRMGLYAANGRLPMPSDDALPIRNYDDTNRQIFLRATHPK